MKESEILQQIRLAASKMGALVWRNNTGMLRNERGHPVFYGLCKGSSDLIGMFKGRFLALEVKMPGKKPTPEQQLFIDTVNKHGGIGAVITDPAQLEGILK